MKRGDCVVVIMIGYNELYFNFKDDDETALTFMRTAADTLEKATEETVTIGMEVKTKEVDLVADTDV